MDHIFLMITCMPGGRKIFMLYIYSCNLVIVRVKILRRVVETEKISTVITIKRRRRIKLV